MPENHAQREWDVDEIIAELNAEYTGVLPVRALRQAQARRDEVAMPLIELIGRATESLRAGKCPRQNGHLFALFLLTEFREKRALPAILKAVSLPNEGALDLFGDAVTESLDGVLAAVATGSPVSIDDLISNQSLNQYVRWKAAQTFLHWVRDGRLGRNEAIQRLRGHLRNAVEERDTEIASGLVAELARYGADEAIDEIREAYRQELVDTFIADLSTVERHLREGEARFQKTLTHRPPIVSDTVTELSQWSSYRKQTGSNSIASPPESLPTLPSGIPESGARTRPRIGRNAACPCGSGKKYKKCCGVR